ncbi:GNAT family N-acetyltransferase [bacterium]|nr:MAG: GNAT family N-acetyltransferase [bacterium]
METSDKNITVRKATLEDASEIVEIHRNCVLETNSQFYPNDVIQEWIKTITVENIEKQFKNSQWAVIDIENKIIGFCQFSFDEKSLYQINISPTYQNMNYGKLLYNFVEKQFLENSINKISLNSTLNAREFYQKLKFKELEQIKFKLDKTFVEMIKMEKVL